MAYEIPNFYVGVLPSVQDLTDSGLAGQFKAVALVGSSGQGAVQLASAGGQVLGICQNKPQVGEATTVMNQGVSKALLGGTVTVGTNLMASTALPGTLIAATSGNFVAAQALEDGVSGDIVAVLLKPSAAKVP